MAGSVNKAVLIGNLGADPEIRKLTSGGAVASFSLATSETWRDKNTGERKERTEWHRVVVFNENLVKLADQYLRKGMKVYVEGQIATRSYEGNDGVKRYTTEIVLKAFRGELQMLEKAQSNRPPAADDPDNYGTQSSRAGDGGAGQSGSSGGTDYSRDLDDEIPF